MRALLDRMPVETALTEANLNPNHACTGDSPRAACADILTSPDGVKSSATTEVEEPVNVPARSATCALCATYGAYSGGLMNWLPWAPFAGQRLRVNGTRGAGEAFGGEEIAGVRRAVVMGKEYLISCTTSRASRPKTWQTHLPRAQHAWASCTPCPLFFTSDSVSSHVL